MSPTTASAAPYYVATGKEIDIFAMCHARGLPVMLKGPTGSGKSRFVEHMAWKLGRPLVTIACHDDLSASDLTGRYLIRGGETVWVDGPLTTAARLGAICYLDEIVEARQDTTVVIHPLTDDRRLLPIDRTGELIEAAPGFQLVISYNPGYQHAIKDLKPSTRQRFVTLEFDYPEAAVEAEIVAHESGVKRATANALVDLALRVRRLKEQGLAEGPGTRLLVSTARLIASGIPAEDACRAALAGPLTDDPDLQSAIDDLVAATL
jgi:nitric oxide reductase NorQ protein